MSSMSLLPVALFLPLFPFSMLFNSLFARVDNTGLRVALMIGWPSAGLVLLAALGDTPPTWIAYWSVATALLYGFRALALRDLALWLGHLATSIWALLWLPAVFGDTGAAGVMTLAVFGLPLALLLWLTGHLDRHYGAAYAGALSGLATSLPRLSGLLVLLVLAVIGTPLFPGFFALLGFVNALLPTMPVSALGVLVLWLLWAWAGMRMLQGLIVGEPDGALRADLGLAHTGMIGATVAVFAMSGFWLAGSLV